MTNWSRIVFAVVALAATVGTARAAPLSWAEAVGELAGERTKAESCAALLKGVGDKREIARGQADYGEAKAVFDGVIAELSVALDTGQNPKSLASLDADLEKGATARAAFCQHVHDRLDAGATGRKGALEDILKAGVTPAVQSLRDAVATLYSDHRKDDELTRATIKTQLEAARWPDFETIKAAR